MSKAPLNESKHHVWTEPRGLESSLQVKGPTTIAEMLGREAGDTGGLSLASSPTFVIKSEPNSTLADYLVVVRQRLNRRALMDLLFSMAPYKAHGPDNFNRLLDNWRIFDRAESSSSSMSLLLSHAGSLGGSWRVFGEHRKLFAEVLGDRTDQLFLEPVIRWRKKSNGRRTWSFESLNDSEGQFVHRLAPGNGEAASEREVFNPLLGFVTIPYFLPELRRNWPAWKPLVKDGKSNYIGPASVPVLALLHRAPILKSDFIRAAETYAEQSAP